MKICRTKGIKGIFNRLSFQTLHILKKMCWIVKGLGKIELLELTVKSTTNHQSYFFGTKEIQAYTETPSTLCCSFSEATDHTEVIHA